MTDETPHHSDDQPRGQHGRFDRDPSTAEVDAEACRLRVAGLTYRAIAEQLGISTSHAHQAVQRAYRAVVREAAEDALTLELERLDHLQAEATELLAGSYIKVVGSGEYTRDLEDVGPKLAAIEVLRKVSESRRKLLGLDQPVRVNVAGSVEFTVQGIPDADMP